MRSTSSVSGIIQSARRRFNADSSRVRAASAERRKAFILNDLCSTYHRHPGQRDRGSGDDDSRENPAIPRGTGAVLSGIVGFLREYIPCFRVLQLDYRRLQSNYSSPGRAMAGGGRSRRRSGRNAFGAMWPPGVMSTRGLAAAAGARAAPPTTSTNSLPTVRRLRPERAVSCYPRQGGMRASTSVASGDSGRRAHRPW